MQKYSWQEKLVIEWCVVEWKIKQEKSVFAKSEAKESQVINDPSLSNFFISSTSVHVPVTNKDYIRWVMREH